MQVHRHHAGDADGLQHVRHHLGGDGHARRTGPAILAGVAEIGNHGGDALGRRALEGVGHHQQFHQAVVGGSAGGLQDEHFPRPYVLLDLDRDLAVGETTDEGMPEPDAQLLHHLLCQRRVGVAGENDEIGRVGGHDGTALALRGCRGRRQLPRSEQRQRMPLRGGQALKGAGEEGFEPSNAGIKIRCLNQLGDSPTTRPGPGRIPDPRGLPDCAAGS